MALAPNRQTATTSADRLGQAALDPRRPLEAGRPRPLTLTYRAGALGIAEGGAVRFLFRTAAGVGPFQTRASAEPNFTSIDSPAGVQVSADYAADGAPEPWSKVLTLRLIEGALRDGDWLKVHFGKGDSVESGLLAPAVSGVALDMRLEVDASGARNFEAGGPVTALPIVSGPPARWRLLIPSQRRVGEPFRLGARAEDAFGNPTERAEGRFRLKASRPTAGLPDMVVFRPGSPAEIMEGVAALAPGDLMIEMLNDDESVLARSNPMRVAADGAERFYWGDLNAASAGAGGLGRVRDVFSIGRDRAFLDVAAHRGLDRLTGKAHWDDVRQAALEAGGFGRFVGLAGFEWTATPAQGGGRGVVFGAPGAAAVARASSPAPRDDWAGPEAARLPALFQSLKGRDAVVIASGARRPADLSGAADEDLERAVEIHSSRGTAEWLLRDALARGRRVGVTASSAADDGRPGLRGGLTCFIARELSAAEILSALRKRRTYATTGSRPYVHVAVEFPEPATRLEGAGGLGETDHAVMGDAVRVSAKRAMLKLDIMAEAPIERVELWNGALLVQIFQTFAAPLLGNRIRVSFEGANTRGGARPAVWDGEASIGGNAIERAAPFGVTHLTKIRAEQTAWTAVTWGGRAGFDLWLADKVTGWLRVKTPVRHISVPVTDIGMAGLRLDCGGAGRQLSFHRLPDQLKSTAFRLNAPLKLSNDAEDAYFVKIVQEDGHMAWTSPVFIGS